MDRLTKAGNACDIMQCLSPDCAGNDPKQWCDTRRVYERLREYEDTGLTPEEIKAQKDSIKNQNGGTES